MNKEKNINIEKVDKLFPIDGNFDLIKSTDNLYFETILDIGLGNGGLLCILLQKAKE